MNARPGQVQPQLLAAHAPPAGDAPADALAHGDDPARCAPAVPLQLGLDHLAALVVRAAPVLSGELLRHQTLHALRLPQAASACPARRAGPARCRCGRAVASSRPRARKRQWRPGTRRRAPTGRAAWPQHLRRSEPACARPACPPLAAARPSPPLGAPPAPCEQARATAGLWVKDGPRFVAGTLSFRCSAKPRPGARGDRPVMPGTVSARQRPAADLRLDRQFAQQCRSPGLVGLCAQHRWRPSRPLAAS